MCGWSFVSESSSLTGLDNCVAFATFLPLMSCVSSILFRELLTVRLLFIVSFNMQFSRCRTVCSLTLQTFLTVYQSFETKIVFDLKSTVNFFINPAATCFPMPSPA